MINLHGWMNGFCWLTDGYGWTDSSLALKRNLMYLGFSAKEANDLAFGVSLGR